MKSENLKENFNISFLIFFKTDVPAVIKIQVIDCHLTISKCTFISIEPLPLEKRIIMINSFLSKINLIQKMAETNTSRGLWCRPWYPHA